MLSDFFARDRSRIRFHDRAGDEPVSLDPARITLLLKNLLSNALRYSPVESGPVDLTVERQGAELIFRVRDHGPGILPGQVARLGEPFYRGDPSRTRRTGGSGLGLYLAILVARAHGGTLELKENSPQGAVFEVRLPVG